jgi:hypothetical protein
MTKTARIVEDLGGFYICDDALPYLDTRGKAYHMRGQAYPSKSAALIAAWESGYDRAVGSGCYRPGSISGQVRIPDWAKRYE